MGDLLLGIDFQLYRDVYLNKDWYPHVKFSIYESFPLGKYDHLDPQKSLTQIGGSGSYTTLFQFVFGKLFHLTDYYFLSARLQLTYSLPAPIRVRGFSAYGGSQDTNGTLYPAQNFNLDFAFELNLSRRWVFAMDLIGQWTGNIRFKGNPGTTLTGQKGNLKVGRGYQYSFAPAIEYNWNQNLGLIFGSWFTFYGKNSIQFYSGLFAINYYM